MLTKRSTSNPRRRMWLVAAGLVLIAAASLGTAAMAATAATSPAAAVKPASEPVSELLEKAIYKEESAGDLDAAIQIYQQIIQHAEANRHAVAEAHYRLGMCLIKKGDKEKGVEILGKLVKDYPEEKDLVKKAHEQRQPALNLIPAPWKNGEAFTLSILAPSGSEIGTLSYTARLTEVKGTPAWEISGEQSVSLNNFTQSTRVVAERDTFAPITGYTKNNLMGEFDAQYSKGLVRLKIKGKQGGQTKEVPLDQTAYDNEQALFLIRRRGAFCATARKLSSPPRSLSCWRFLRPGRAGRSRARKSCAASGDGTCSSRLGAWTGALPPCAPRSKRPPRGPFT